MTKKIITVDEFYKMYEEIITCEFGLKFTKSNLTHIPKKNLKKTRIAILLAFKSGLREKEILNLRRENFQGESILIPSKNGRLRIVPKPEEIDDSCLGVFPLEITDRTLQYHFKKIVMGTLNKDIKFRTLRDSFIHNQIKNGKSFEKLCELVGIYGQHRFLTLMEYKEGGKNE